MQMNMRAGIVLSVLLILCTLFALFGGGITHALLPHEHTHGGFWESFHTALRTFEDAFLLVLMCVCAVSIVSYALIRERTPLAFLRVTRTYFGFRIVEELLRRGVVRYRAFG